jgi:periplasmic protein TonB
MNHRAQVRAMQDHVLRDSLAGSSMSALTLVVAALLAAQVMPKSIVTHDPRPVDWPEEPVVIIDVAEPIPGGPPPAPPMPPVVAAVLPTLDADADTTLIEEIPSAMPSPSFGEPGPGPVGSPGKGPAGAATEGVIPPPHEWVVHDELPEVVRRVIPVFPDAMRQAGMEGQVRVRIFVGTDGKVRRAEVEGKPTVFDDAALNAVRQWVFTPAKSNGQPVGVWMRIPIVFRLD